MQRGRLGFAIRSVGAGLVLFCAATLYAPPPSADAAVVEKIVAVVGDDAILLSELRSRAAPLIRVLASKAPAGPQRTAAESQVYRDVLSRMIEETLEVQAAERQKVTVSPEEVDKAVENVASQQHLTVDQLLTFAEQRSGLSEIDYRAEIRRQVLEGKLLSQRVRGRIRLTEEDLKNAFNRALREERDRREYRPEIILLAIPPNASPQVVAEREKLAASIHDQLKKGAKFEDLATQYSDEPKTNQKGGDMGIYAPIKTQAAQLGKRPALSEEVEAKVLPLEPGEYTQPFRLADAILIMGLKNRQPSKYTTFEAAKEEMVQRVQNEILAREKETWIEELRKRDAHRDPSLTEAPSDCTTCGRCCFDERATYLPVFGVDLDRMGERARSHTREADGRRYLTLADGHCSALSIEGGRYVCSIYEERPDVCRWLARGSGPCIEKIDTIDPSRLVRR